MADKREELDASIAEALNEVLRQEKWTQKEAARRLGAYNQAHISMVKNGQRRANMLMVINLLRQSQYARRVILQDETT